MLALIWNRFWPRSKDNSTGTDQTPGCGSAITLFSWRKDPVPVKNGFSKVTLVVGETRTTAFSTDEALLQKPGVHKFFLLADNEDGERTHKVIVD